MTLTLWPRPAPAPFSSLRRELLLAANASGHSGYAALSAGLLLPLEGGDSRVSPEGPPAESESESESSQPEPESLACEVAWGASGGAADRGALGGVIGCGHAAAAAAAVAARAEAGSDFGGAGSSMAGEMSHRGVEHPASAGRGLGGREEGAGGGGRGKVREGATLVQAGQA